ncbi:MAG: chromate transporter [Synergistes sp.]|nr:chromate transporter [Synergistes sp.]
MIKILQLAAAFAEIGVTVFGGGLSSLPIIEYQLVTKYGWMSASDFTQLIAVSQVTPGPIAINAATFAGYSEAGVAGAIAATLSLVAAPVAVLSVVLFTLQKINAEKIGKFKQMLRPIVAGLITLSITAPFMSTLHNGSIAVAMFVFGVIILKYCKFVKKYPVIMLFAFGCVGALFLR